MAYIGSLFDKLARIRADCWVFVWAAAFAYAGLFVYSFRCFLHPLSFWRTNTRNPPEALSNIEWGSAGSVDIDGKTIKFMKKGDHTKPMILFIHGFPEFWFSWRHQLQHFGNFYWAVAVDLPGLGDSDVPDRKEDFQIEKVAELMIKFVEALGRDRCIVVGSGLGGMIAWEMAAKKPELVEKLVVVNATRYQVLLTATRNSWSQFLKSWYLLADKIPYLPEIFVKSQDFSVLGGVLQGVSNDELEAYKYTFAKKDTIHNALEYYRNLDFKVAYTSTSVTPVEVPTLLIMGENGQTLTQNVVDLDKMGASKATVKTLNGTGAFPQWEDPQNFNKIVEDFIQ